MKSSELVKAEKILPDNIKAAIAKRSRNKGSNYEREVAKKIASYFGWKWSDAFIRTSLSSYAQPEGDLRPINDMKNLWQGARLGPLECKNRASWSFDQLFKTPHKSELYRYWTKSNLDTGSDNTILVFTKNGVSDLVMCLVNNVNPTDQVTQIYCKIEGNSFIILTLDNFLKTLWSR